MIKRDIYLLRHAQTDWNVEPKRYQGRADVPISDKVRLSSLSSLSKIDWHLFDCVVASPAIRCRQTLELAKQVGFAPKYEYFDHNLWEIDNGWYSGKTAAEICKIDKSNFELFSSGSLDVRVGGGESINDMVARVENGIRYWLDQLHGSQPIFFVHGGPIRCILGRRVGFALDQFHTFRVPNLSFWKISTTNLSEW